MWLLAVAALALVACDADASTPVRPCPDGECYAIDGCVASVVGTKCFDCSRNGYLLDGVCVCYASPFAINQDTCARLVQPDPFIPSSICDLAAGQCEVSPGVCGLSRFGARCYGECAGNGYVVPCDPVGLENGFCCVCYTPTVFDAASTCSYARVQTGSLETLEVVQSFDTEVPHQSKELGWWNDVAAQSAARPYGSSNPPTPDRCLREPFGPEAGTVVAAVPLYDCNAYVALDPDRPHPETDNGTRVVCGGHGDWSAADYRCNCHVGWQLTRSGFMGWDNETEALVCTSCAGWFGPPFPVDGIAMCSVPWVPDPVDGEGAQCGGHGVLGASGECVCRSNDVEGHWTNAPVEQVFDEYRWVGDHAALVPYSSTVQACVACPFGYSPAAGTSTRPCIHSGDTHSPTDSPTAAPALVPAIGLVQLLANSDGAFGYDPTKCVPIAPATAGAQFLEYGGVDLAGLANFYAFDPSAPVVNGNTREPIAVNYTELVAGRLLVSLRDAGVTGAPRFWISGCGNWGNASAMGVSRSTDTVDGPDDQETACDDTEAVLGMMWYS